MRPYPERNLPQIRRCLPLGSVTRDLGGLILITLGSLRTKPQFTIFRLYTLCKITPAMAQQYPTLDMNSSKSPLWIYD